MATPLLIPDQDSLKTVPTPSASPRSFQLFGAQMTIHADSHDTLGGFSLVEMSGPGGGEPPLHVHSREDELFYVVEGELSVRRGYEILTLRPGQSAFLPRNVPHTFKVVSKTAKVLVYITPGGFEEYFRAVAAHLDSPHSVGLDTSFERMSEIAARHGIKFLG